LSVMTLKRVSALMRREAENRTRLEPRARASRWWATGRWFAVWDGSDPGGRSEAWSGALSPVSRSSSAWAGWNLSHNAPTIRSPEGAACAGGSRRHHLRTAHHQQRHPARYAGRIICPPSVLPQSLGL